MTPAPLTWLFEAEFMDGFVYEQTPDDRSRDTPENSCFTDVLTLVRDGKRLRRFGLFRGNEHVIVDLLSGHFQVNGLPFLLPPPPPGAALSVWYSRTRTVHRTFNQTMTDVVRDWEEPIVYNIGWQTDTGQQQVLSVV